MKKVISALIITLLIFSVMTALSSCGQANKLYGTWTQGDPIVSSYTFEKDGKGLHVFGTEEKEFTYMLEDGVISLTYADGEAVTYNYSVADGTLTLASSDLLEFKFVKN